MALASGTRLGPYEILDPLGAGGMGEVYKARDTRLDRTVAIKVLPDRLSSPDSRQRFEREAKTISQLSHPHICALYDVGHQDGIEYLVMEYLEGETLAERLLRGELPLEQVLRYAIEIADALDRAHRHGVVHRDLKPGNVMLTRSGVKLLDFGLARRRPLDAAGREQTAAAQEPRAHDHFTALRTETSPLTQEGTILGTFQYMAPEQLEGKEADARTDIFAFGAVLYEMASGKKAFTGSSQASLISAILRDDPPPISQAQSTTPASLDRLISTCLAKDPERRWQSARDVALQLAAVPVKETPSSEGPAARRRAGWAALAGWAFAALLLAAGLLFAPWRQHPSGPARFRFLIAPPTASGFEGMLALSPEGKRLAFVAAAADGKDLVWVRPLDSLEPRPLAGTDGAAYPFWSPDGQSIAFFADGKLKRIDLSGGPPRTLCEAAGPRGGSWGSRGSIVFAAATGGQMKVVSDSGGEPRTLAQLALKPGDVHRWPSFLPDGDHFLFFALGAEVNTPGVSVASLDSPAKKTVAVADSGAVYVAPGHIVYRSGDRLMKQPFDLGALRVTGSPVPLVEDVWWDGMTTLATAFSASADVLAYQTGGLSTTRLVLYDRSGRELGSLGPPGQYAEPALSPDGRWLAISRAEPGARAPQVWMIDLERGGFSRVSAQEFAGATPVWSPDGGRIAYSAFPSGQVYVREAHGSEKEKPLFKPEAFSPLDDWSSDGRFIFREVIDWRTFHFDVAARDLQTGSDQPVLTAAFSQNGARLSPDRRWLAYESEESGASEIFVRSFPEPKERRQVSSGGGTQPRWRSDGKELFYVSPDRKIMAIEVRAGATFETGAPRALFATRIFPTIETRNQYDVMGDGSRFLVNSRRAEESSLPITVLTGWNSERRR